MGLRGFLLSGLGASVASRATWHDQNLLAQAGGGGPSPLVLAELHGVHEERHRVDLGERYVHSFGLW